MAGEFIISDDGTKVLLNKEYAEAYIPVSLFKDIDDVKQSALAYTYGEGFCIMGLFNIRFFDSRDNISRSNVPIRTFNYPNMIYTYPSSSVDETFVLFEDQEIYSDEVGDLEESPTRYRILRYYKGDIIMDVNTERLSKNCEKFLNMLIRGYIPRTISYTDLRKAWITNYNINNVDPGVPDVALQAVISEMYRNPANPSEQFRIVAGKGNYNPMGYLPSNMRRVTSYTSVLNSLTFETIGDMLVSSINMIKEDRDQNVSPIEVILSV